MRASRANIFSLAVIVVSWRKRRAKGTRPEHLAQPACLLRLFSPFVARRTASSLNSAVNSRRGPCRRRGKVNARPRLYEDADARRKRYQEMRETAKAESRAKFSGRLRRATGHIR